MQSACSILWYAMYSELAVAEDLMTFMEKLVYSSICLQMSLQYSDNL